MYDLIWRSIATNRVCLVGREMQVGLLVRPVLARLCALFGKW